MATRMLEIVDIYACKSLDSDAWIWNYTELAGRITYDKFLEIFKSPRAILKLLRTDFYLSEHTAGNVKIHDDGVYLLVELRNGQPLFGIKYGDYPELRELLATERMMKDAQIN